MAAGRSQKPAGESLETVRAANASSEFYFAGAMFVIAALIPWYFELPLNFDITDPEFNPLVFVPVVFAAIGTISLLRTGLTTLRARKFGSATLSPTVAQRGELFRPVMRTSSDVETTGDFVFVLKCIRTVVSGDDFEGHKADKVLWKHSETAPASTRSSQGVPVMFRVPSDMPPTRGPDKATNGGNVRWVVSVTVPTRGVNFYAEFIISVR